VKTKDSIVDWFALACICLAFYVVYGFIMYTVMRG
jgi:hypothetical protein